MKLIHLSDLHLGKRVLEFSMLEEQEYILTKIINIIDDEKPDGILVAGDVYDKSMPSEEAVTLLDNFLARIAKREIPIFIISGNHDSAERVSFGAQLMKRSGVHISEVYGGKIEPVTLTDEYGELNVFLLPFLKPPHVQRFYPDAKIKTYTDSLRVTIENMAINTNLRNVLVAHQFVTGAARCDSEETVIGGLDNVDAEVFDAFDYVALGHLHGKQNIGRETVRYCGTPLKYSLSESGHNKSLTVVELAGKGSVSVREVPLSPRRDIRAVYGDFASFEALGSNASDDYIHVTLTDEDDIPDAMSSLRSVFPKVMKLSYDNKRTRKKCAITALGAQRNYAPIELFSELFERQNNQKMSDEQHTFVSKLISKIWEAAK